MNNSVISRDGSSNTRLDSQQVRKQLEDTYKTTSVSTRIDWLTIGYRLPVEIFREKIDFLLDWLDDAVDWSEDRAIKIGRWFDHSAKTIRGSTVAWNCKEDYIDVIVSLTGGMLASVQPKSLSRGLLHLHQWYSNCSRIDIALDADGELLPRLRQEARSAWEQRLHSGFQKYGRVDSGNSLVESKLTHYWGSRDAATYTRIYDKDGYTRFEVESKREKSGMIYENFINQLQNGVPIDECFRSVFFASIDGIDFYSEQKDKNLDRNERAEFWQTFLDLIGYTKIELKVEKKIKVIQDSIQWIEKSVAATLAMVRIYFGDMAPQFMSDLFRKGREKMTKLQRMKAEKAKSEGSEWITCEG